MRIPPAPRARRDRANAEHWTRCTTPRRFGSVRRLTVPYACDDEEALARLRALGDYWLAKHGVKVTWDGPRGRLVGKKMGVRYDGTVTVADRRAVCEVDAGWLADKLGAPAYVERKLRDYLDPSHSLESLLARVPR